MKFIQEKEFKPISIILETKKEAQDFISIIDKINNYCNRNDLIVSEVELINKISDAFSNELNI